MKQLKTIVVAVLFFSLPFSSMAWGKLGHRIVGEIAESYLTPKAKLAIKAILGNESIAIASNWADFIKSDSSYKYVSSWHYVDLPDSLDKEGLHNYLLNDTTADAYTKLNFLIKELKNKNLSKDKKIFYLRLLIHIVGDVHQPFHVARASDLGGNKIKVKWFRDATNIHAVWDDELINFQQLSYTEYAKAINFTTPAQRAEWQKTPIWQWLYESNQIAVSLYKEITVPDQKLGYDYNYEHIDTLNLQLLKGGVRLAGVLNEIFGT
jgi:hypothetical protein